MTHKLMAVIPVKEDVKRPLKEDAKFPPAVSEWQKALIEEAGIVPSNSVDDTANDPILSRSPDEHVADAERQIARMVREQNAENARGRRGSGGTWIDHGYTR